MEMRNPAAPAVDAGNDAYNTPDLRRFFAPKTVALVGASGDRNRFGGKVLHRLLHFGSTGEVFAVNPSAREVQGVRCYASLRELPVAPEHVGIAVPAQHVFSVLEDCAALGTRFVTLFSAGFAETGTAEGRALQDRLAAFARATGIRIMGPNCNGLINYVDGFAFTSTGTITGERRRAGNIGLIAQTGGAAQVNVMWRAQEIGLDLSYQASCGNCADLDLLDFARFMVDDDHTDVIMMIAEGITNGAKLYDVASRAADKHKPIVVLKLGRTEVGTRAARSHTGAVTGSDAVHDAAFRQWGIIRVNDCNELYETAMLLKGGRVPQRRRAAALSVSGGNAAIVADLGASVGVEWPEFSAQTQEQLAALLPKHGRASNPIDVTSAAVGSDDVYRRCIEILAKDPNVDVIVPVLTFAPRSDVDQILDAATQVKKPVALLWTGGCYDREITPKYAIAKGLPVYRDALSCLRAVRAAMNYGEFLDARERRAARQRPADIDVAVARTILADLSGTLSERTSKTVLAAYGFPVPPEMLARNVDEAVKAAVEIGGPVALKIESVDIPHKTDAGAIRLNVQGADAVREGFAAVMGAAAAYAPAAKVDGVLVQKMAAPGGTEMILGFAGDPIFGPVVMAGLGGIHVEVLRDVAFRVPPIDIDEARSMLRELRAFRVLEGVRGQGPRDINALCDLIVRLSWLACDLRDRVEELDINPILVYDVGKPASVVDALVSLRDRSDAS